ncbi:MAG: VWA domain-containing protein [Thermoanaerobaculia bacterium]|nr:VWA domain-containing protein [Thermoanaerobaculia bacterium]
MPSPGHLRDAATGIAIAALLLGGLPAAAQEDAIPLVFQEVLDVRVVNVEVVVTDSAGNRVRGLEATDFRLLVDGEEMPIDYFSEVVGGQVAERQVAEGEPAAVPSLEPGRAVGTSYLIFIDDFFSIARDRNRVLKRFAEQIQQMGPEDRVAIVAYDGRELEMLTSWTNSERVIESALRRAQDRKAYGLHRMGELRQNDQDRADRRYVRDSANEVLAASGFEPIDGYSLIAQLDPVERPYAERLTRQIERSVNAAVATLRGFASPEGRKAMVVLAGGWPFSPAEYTVNDFDSELGDVVTAANDPFFKSHGELFAPLADTANLLGYTLYPVDVPGMQQDSRDASYSQPSRGRIYREYSAMPRENASHASLDFLARETGGDAMINSQRDDFFTRVVEDTRSYYWLGFSPQRSGDDSSHDIEVQVLRKGMRVRSRDSYLDFSRQSEQTMMVESALLFGDPPSATPLDLRFGRPERKSGKMHVPLEVSIPLDEVAMLPIGDDLYGADLEVRISVMDTEGGRSDTPVSTIQVRGPQPPDPGDYFTFVTNLVMRKRNHRVVVAVWDPVGGEVMSASVEIEP